MVSADEYISDEKKNRIYAKSVSVSEASFHETSAFHRFKDSFRRADIPSAEDLAESQLDSIYGDNHNKQYRLATQPLKKKLKPRHQTMLAIGGTLGTGLFIGLGYSLTSGPASLLIGFLLVGLSMFCVVQSAAELSCQFPVSGSYATHVSRFIDDSVGFTAASNYAMSWLISFPNELIGIAMTLNYWNDTVNPSIWVAIFFVFIMGLNLFGVEAFAETEFVFCIIKILGIVVFLIIGIVLICGGGPNSEGYIGTKYWHDPGSFAHPVFKSLCNTFVSAAFSFSGSELVLITAAESKSISALSRAAKGTFWRIAIFYIATVVVIGCLVPYTDIRLLGGSSSEDVTASPFVIALSNSGSLGGRLANFMNVIVFVAVLSVANSSVYASSRVIQAMGVVGQLPSCCAYIDKRGRPLVGIAISGAFGLLGFIAASSNESTVFTWLFSLSSMSCFFTWGCICLAQVRYRLALRYHGRSTEEIAYKSIMGLLGGIFGTLLNFVLIIGEIYVSAFPLGEASSANIFFQSCLSIPIMIVLFLGHRIYRNDWGNWLISIKDLDIDTGSSIDDFELFQKQRKEEQERIKNSPFYYRIYRFWC